MESIISTNFPNTVLDGTKKGRHYESTDSRYSSLPDWQLKLIDFTRAETSDDLFIDSIELESGKFLYPINTTLVFRVTKEDDLFCTEIEELNYPMADYSKEDLKESVEVTISFMWSECAHEPDENLQFFGPKIKRYLLDTFEESV